MVQFFQVCFLLANVFMASTYSLHVWPPGWYVDDRNRDNEIGFQCLDGGFGKVMWMFKGKDLSVSSPCISGATRMVCGPSLYISKFQDEYAGVYTCRKLSTSREVHLGVQPKFVDPNQTEYIAAVGERVELDCSLRPTVYPRASVLWQKREGNLVRRVHEGEKFTILKSGLKDSGMYICKATNNPHNPLASSLKAAVLYVYVPASCNFISAKNIDNNVSVTVELSGTPQPRFSSVHPWHHLASNTSGLAVATRSGSFRESSRQLIGHLIQVVTSGRKTQIVTNPCNPYIDIPSRRLQMCVFIRFTPTIAFCAINPSFNNQAKELIQHLVVYLYILNAGCHYDGATRTVLVESGRCQPFRIVAYIQSDVNSSFHCRNASRINSLLSLWNSSATYGIAEILKNGNDQYINLSLCSTLIPNVSLAGCHRVFYCNKSPKKDRTVCLEYGYFRKRLSQGGQNTVQYFGAKNPRLLCSVTFVAPELTVRT